MSRANRQRVKGWSNTPPQTDGECWIAGGDMIAVVAIVTIKGERYVYGLGPPGAPRLADMVAAGCEFAPITKLLHFPKQ